MAMVAVEVSHEALKAGGRFSLHAGPKARTLAMDRAD
jgi:hypothetical protein